VDGNLQLVDPLFDQGRTEKYRLSILLQPDGFSFCVIDTRTLTYLALAHYSNNTPYVAGSQGTETLCDFLESYFESEELLRLKYNAMDLVVCSPKVTLVPPGFLSEETMEDYFRLNHRLETSEIIATQVIPVGEMSALYAVPACIDQIAVKRLNGIKAGSSATILIQSLLRANAHILARQVFVNVWSNNLDIIVIQGRRLLYFNSFRKNAPEDLVYYLVYVLEQMGFIPAEEEVTLMGDIDTDSADYRLMYQYIDRLHFAALSNDGEFSPAFAEVKVHKYFTLFNIPFCGS